MKYTFKKKIEEQTPVILSSQLKWLKNKILLESQLEISILLSIFGIGGQLYFEATQENIFNDGYTSYP